MAWSADEKERVLQIEQEINKIQVALTNVASTKQLKTLLVLKQNEIDALTTRVTALESQLALLQSSV